MHISELQKELPREIIESANERGITKLTPPQEKAVEHGLLDGKDIVVASPTASGKTFIAEIAMLNAVFWKKRKALYIAPMRALVSEKFSELKAAYPYLKIAMSMGELDSLDMWLQNYDIIFVSTEKLDSLIRHGIKWLDEIGCVVIDELHMLGEFGRGPALEILITRLRRTCADSQFIYLSATIGNAKDIAKWLNAELVVSEYRPVPLEKGVIVKEHIFYGEKTDKLDSKSENSEIKITEDTIKRSKQILIFYSSKRNTEAAAERLSITTSRFLTDNEKIYLEELSSKILNALGKPTQQCEKLSRMVKKGIAFHHSGLINSQRAMVEDAFRSGYIKAICSTTTLGIGVNLPANTVLIRDITRYNTEQGQIRLGINEVTQLFGRAGRPKYDTYGRALLIAKTDSEARELYNTYVLSELEPVESVLGYMPVLRSHILSFIATSFLTIDDAILSFLNETFYGFSKGGVADLKTIIKDVLEQLSSWNFIENQDGRYTPTKIGKRISELYIDPVSAKWLIDSLPKIKDEVSSLFMISNTLEMRPYAKVIEEAEDKLPSYSYMYEDYYVGEGEFYDLSKPFSTALMLNDWINEAGDGGIMIKYHETPGALYSKTANADWMLYSSTELAKLLHIAPARLVELRIRVKYGIKKELLDLTRLEQVGRVRARIMFNAGIKTVKDLKKIESRQKIEALFGSEISKRILSQIEDVL